MADRVSSEVRSRIMRAIRSRDTGPELALAEAMSAAGVEFDRPNRSERLPGSPDFVVRAARLAVFSHGCYWHLCRLHYRQPGSDGWRRKMDTNRRRDARVRRQLRRLGWWTMVVWEHEAAARGAARVAARAARLASVVHGPGATRAQPAQHAPLADLPEMDHAIPRVEQEVGNPAVGLVAGGVVTEVGEVGEAGDLQRHGVLEGRTSKRWSERHGMTGVADRNKDGVHGRKL